MHACTSSMQHSEAQLESEECTVARRQSLGNDEIKVKLLQSAQPELAATDWRSKICTEPKILKLLQSLLTRILWSIGKNQQDW